MQQSAIRLRNIKFLVLRLIIASFFLASATCPLSFRGGAVCNQIAKRLEKRCGLPKLYPTTVKTATANGFIKEEGPLRLTASGACVEQEVRLPCLRHQLVELFDVARDGAEERRRPLIDGRLLRLLGRRRDREAVAAEVELRILRVRVEVREHAS